MDEEIVRGVCQEYKLSNCEIVVKYPNASVDELIDAIIGTRVYMPALFVLNKIDAISIEELDLLARVPHYAMISAKDEWNFDDLLEKIWTYCNMIRMYVNFHFLLTPFFLCRIYFVF